VAKPTPFRQYDSRKEIRLSRRKKLVFGGIAAATALAGGIAYASWSVGGTGDAKAAAGHVQQLVITSPAAVQSQLYPSGDADVTLSVHNPNSFTVSFTVAQTTGSDITSGNATCDASNGVSFNAPATTYQVDGTDDLEIHIPAGASMSNASVDACQDATFTIPVTLTGASA
jgi:hypothetical protein